MLCVHVSMHMGGEDSEEGRIDDRTPKSGVVEAHLAVPLCARKFQPI